MYRQVASDSYSSQPQKLSMEQNNVHCDKKNAQFN